MKENMKRKIAMLLTLLGVTSIVIGTTFAIYENTINTNKNHIIKTGVVNFTLTESTNGIVLNNLQELTDYEGMAQEEYYEFTIKNTGDTKTDYEISLVDKPNSSYTGTILNEKYIKVGLLKNNSKEIIVNLKEVNRLIDKVTLDVEETVNYKLRLWLDFGDLEDEAKEALVGQKIFLALKINGIQNVNTIESMDTSGANKPILASNMIPVYYDETNDVWKKADKDNSQKDYRWYSYESSGEYKGMWANAVTVKDTNRQTYLNATPGTTISMDDITTMWVWIPRFNAVTPSNYNGGTKEKPNAIDVTFVKQNETAIDAFTFGDKQLSGFWYGKFEIGGSLASSCTNETCNVSNIVVKPNAEALRGQTISDLFYASRSMEQPGNSFGFVSSEVDTHMSKNNEWGAVAYLTQSIYGRCTSSTSCTEVYINNSSGMYTGRSGGNIGGSTPINGTYTDQTSTTQNNTYGFYTYDDYLLNYNTNTKGNKVKGKGTGASTTGTIYGIYDMSGGISEYVMGVLADPNGKPRSGGNSSNSGFTGMLKDGTIYTGIAFPDSKYYNLYTDNSSYIGHALTETANWYESAYSFINSERPWITRGGIFGSENNSGIFSITHYGFNDWAPLFGSRYVITNE